MSRLIKRFMASRGGLVEVHEVDGGTDQSYFDAFWVRGSTSQPVERAQQRLLGCTINCVKMWDPDIEPLAEVLS